MMKSSFLIKNLLLPSFSLVRSAVVEQTEENKPIFDFYFRKFLKVPVDSTVDSTGLTTGLELNQLFDSCDENDLNDYVIRKAPAVVFQYHVVDNCQTEDVGTIDEEFKCDVSCVDSNYELWEYNVTDINDIDVHPHSQNKDGLEAQFVCRPVRVVGSNTREIVDDFADDQWANYYMWTYQPMYYGREKKIFQVDRLFHSCLAKPFESCPSPIDIGASYYTDEGKVKFVDNGLFYRQRLLTSYELNAGQNKIHDKKVGWGKKIAPSGQRVDLEVAIPSQKIRDYFEIFAGTPLPDFASEGWTVEVKLNQTIGDAYFQSADGTGLSTVFDGSSLFLHSFPTNKDRNVFNDQDQDFLFISLQLISKTQGEGGYVFPDDLAVDNVRVFAGEFTNLQCLYDPDNFPAAGVMRNGNQVEYTDGMFFTSLENNYNNVTPVDPFAPSSQTCSGDSDGSESDDAIAWENVPDELKTDELQYFLHGQLSQIKTTFGNEGDTTEYCLTDQTDTSILSYNPVTYNYTTHYDLQWTECENIDITDLNTLSTSEYVAASKQLFTYQRNEVSGIYQLKNHDGDKCVTPFPISASFHENLESCDSWKYFDNAGTFLFLYDCSDQTDGTEVSQEFVYNIDSKKLVSGCAHGLPVGKTDRSEDGSFHAFLTGDTDTLSSGESAELDFGVVESALEGRSLSILLKDEKKKRQKLQKGKKGQNNKSELKITDFGKTRAPRINLKSGFEAEDSPKSKVPNWIFYDAEYSMNG